MRQRNTEIRRASTGLRGEPSASDDGRAGPSDFGKNALPAIGLTATPGNFAAATNGRPIATNGSARCFAGMQYAHAACATLRHRPCRP